MIFACLFSGVVLGLISAIITALLGYGVILALLAYILGGIIGMGVLLAVGLLHQQQFGRLVATES